LRILLSNDDGIFSDGIQALAQVIKRDHEIVLVAPDKERSAASQSITMRKPLSASREHFDALKGVTCYAVSGTPADCVKLGLLHIKEGPFDAVITGINHGQNMGTDILYSGTVGAAMEACIQGYPAMAVSLLSRKGTFDDFLAAATLAKEVIDSGAVTGLPKFTMLNMNVPIGAAEIRWARQGFTRFDEHYEVTDDGFIQLTGKGFVEIKQAHPDTDVDLLRAGYASITPLTYNMTDTKSLKAMKERFPSFNG
jgi:5'-nucleotidase